MASGGVLDRIRAVMMTVRQPGHYDKVYKDECMFTFDTPFSPGGLYINLNTHQAFGEEYVGLDLERTGNALYMHEKWIKSKLVNKVPLDEEEMKKLAATPDRLAIGGEGGFQVDKNKYNVEKQFALVVMPENLRVPLPCPELPEIVLQTIKAVQDHTSVAVQDSVAVWSEDDNLGPSKYASTLEQLPATRKIPSNPQEWKCDDTGVKENLWLNLSTGFIGSGRKNFDGTGGNGSALRHFEATGRKYPLVVKLGTITPHGADVYSYAPDEDTMVLDPLLDKHLAHWGINMLQMEKTEKTMNEMQVEINLSFEFNRITEAGEKLVPVHGPGHVGLRNIGNSCYMNSVIQMIWMVPGLVDRYLAKSSDIFQTSPGDPAMDFPTQMSKVGVALMTCRTGNPHPEGDTNAVVEDLDVETEYWGVRPHFFKTLVGRNHREFSTMHQQDASEYFMHLLEVMDKSEASEDARLGITDGTPTSHAFAFELEERIQCLESNWVQYKRGEYKVLMLDIPIEAAVNKEEVDSYKEREMKRQKLREADAEMEITQEGMENGVPKVSAITRDSDEEKVLPKVPFSACIAQLTADTVVDHYDCAILKKKTQALKTTKFGSFPPYLVVQLQRYYYADNWTPRKKEVLVELPDELDLEHLRSKGLQPGEQEQPADPDQPHAQGHQGSQGIMADADLVAQLVAMGMGFSENGLMRAAVATNNASPEAAMEWVLTHMDDADFNDPLPDNTPPGADEPKQLEVEKLIAMGFPENAAKAALIVCKNSTERAADWLIGNMDNLDAAVAEVLQTSTPAERPSPSTSLSVDDGPGKYELVGFVSHMGSNTTCGHYVCHLRKNDRWIIFNDESVAVSEKPPKDLGFMYMYKRKQSV